MQSRKQKRYHVEAIISYSDPEAQVRSVGVTHKVDLLSWPKAAPIAALLWAMAEQNAYLTSENAKIVSIKICRCDTLKRVGGKADYVPIWTDTVFSWPVPGKDDTVRQCYDNLAEEERREGARSFTVAPHEEAS